ncbi:MAG: lipopolysaccharide heptosyltransferase II [Planctomycetes bacterium]|nr:lipopolysaccharide heptosyltransferase II [Planctomycetota bacterium]MBI3834681.1 lipopolysaccharide heptosyltransferase II [Planctomycetota bacterium]
MTATLKTHDFRRILLIKPSSLGDVIHALPVLHALRLRYPNARIDWLINKSLAPLIEGHPKLSNVIGFDRGRFGALLTKRGAMADFWRFIRKLRQAKYDLVIDLQGLFRTGFLAWASGADVRIGFREAREGSRFFYTDLIETPDADEHAVDRNFRAVEMLGCARNEVNFDLALRPADHANALELLNSSGLDPSSQFAVVLPGARWETKRWAAERFGAVMNELDDAGAICVLLGSPDESDLCERVANSCRRPPINLCSKTPLRTMAVIIERAEIVICHDSGPMHIAAALNRRLVCINGPTNPLRTGPYHRLNDVVRLDIPCSPCYLRKLSQCPHDHRCMRELDSDLVINAIRDQVLVRCS